jgi:sterol desaturase/sphingolipid hydroxylase (fatty acid hydroxylase superfamily)
MTALENLLNILKPVVDVLLTPTSAISIYSVAFAVTLAFAFLAQRQKRRRGRVRLRAIARAMFRRQVLFHRSTFADIGYFLLGTLSFGALFGWALFSASAIADVVAGFLQGHLGQRAPLEAPDFVLRTGRTLVLFFAYELGFFIDHTLKHRIPALWELHKTHHSAEVLTPLTNFRVHPVDSIILWNNLALATGLFGGIAQYALGKSVESFTLDGQNILMILYIYLTAQLQHSHFWIPMRGWLGRVFMSPAHHQIHHSTDSAHFNRNMGASLAIWDWLFGTLAIPEKEPPKIKFGAAMDDRDPHSVTTLLLDPLLNALGALIGRKLPLTPTGATPTAARETSTRS